MEDKLGRRAFSTLTLNILDQNDQEPVFISKKYSCSISATAKEGDAVLMVSATDEDEHDTIEYSLVSDPSGLFRLHPRLGVLSLVDKLDRSGRLLNHFLLDSFSRNNLSASSRSDRHGKPATFGNHRN